MKSKQPKIIKLDIVKQYTSFNNCIKQAYGKITIVQNNLLGAEDQQAQGKDL